MVIDKTDPVGPAWQAVLTFVHVNQSNTALVLFLDLVSSKASVPGTSKEFFTGFVEFERSRCMPMSYNFVSYEFVQLLEFFFAALIV